MRKWPVRPAFVLLLAALLSSCSPPVESSSQPELVPSSTWTGSDVADYRAGHSDGSKDKRKGRPYNPRHPNPDQAVTRQYFRGYEDGFRNPNDNPWSQHRAYELGSQQGRRDKLAGLSMDPARRLAKEVPQAVREHFRNGYREGWRTAQ